MMIAYEYVCRNGHTEVHSFPMGEAPEKVGNCPRCGEEMLRSWQIAGVVFKGSGFYSTDTRRPYIDRDAAGKKETD